MGEAFFISSIGECDSCSDKMRFIINQSSVNRPLGGTGGAATEDEVDETGADEAIVAGTGADKAVVAGTKADGSNVAGSGADSGGADVV